MTNLRSGPNDGGRSVFSAHERERGVSYTSSRGIGRIRVGYVGL